MDRPHPQLNHLRERPVRKRLARVTPRPKGASFSRRDFLKLAGAAGAGLGIPPGIVDAFGRRAGGVAYAQEGGQPTSPESGVEQYLAALDERFNVNAIQDPISLQLSEKGINEVRTQSGFDLLGNGTYYRPTPEMFADAVYGALKKTDYQGSFNRDGIVDFLVRQWGPGNLGPGQKEGTTLFVKVGEDPDTGKARYALNTSDQWKEAFKIMVPMAIPFEVVRSTAAGAPEAAPGQPLSEAAEAAPQPEEGPLVTGSAESHATPPAIPGTEGKDATTEKRNKLLAVFGMLFAGGVSALGLGWLFGRGRGGEVAPSPLEQARGQRQKSGISHESLKALEGDRQRARDMANKIKRGGNL